MCNLRIEIVKVQMFKDTPPRMRIHEANYLLVISLEILIAVKITVIIPGIESKTEQCSIDSPTRDTKGDHSS